MPAEPRKAFWRFDRDQTNRVSTERIGREQPVADSQSPVTAYAAATPHPAEARKVLRMARPHAAELRRAIDDGRSGDKVAHPDPAAAPLGTDDEAAGAAPGPERVAMAMAHEGNARPAACGSTDPDRGSRLGLILALLAAAALALVIAAIIARA